MTHPAIQTITKLVDKNAVYILTAVAITGAFSTAILVGEATPKALRIIEENKCRTNLEKIQSTWKCYIPAGISLLITIGSIVGVNDISQRRNAALAGLYSLAQTSLNEYKDKVIETLGENKERKIRDEIALDRITNNPPSDIIVTGSGDVLCYDALTGRYFFSDIEKIRKIINELNKELLTAMFVPLNDFYYELGLDQTTIGDNVGFDIDKGLFEISFSSQLTKEGKPCLVLTYEVHSKYSQ